MKQTIEQFLRATLRAACRPGFFRKTLDSHGGVYNITINYGEEKAIGGKI